MTIVFEGLQGFGAFWSKRPDLNFYFSQKSLLTDATVPVLTLMYGDGVTALPRCHSSAREKESSACWKGQYFQSPGAPATTLHSVHTHLLLYQRSGCCHCRAACSPGQWCLAASAGTRCCQLGWQSSLTSPSAPRALSPAVFPCSRSNLRSHKKTQTSSLVRSRREDCKQCLCSIPWLYVAGWIPISPRKTQWAELLPKSHRRCRA